MKSIKQITQEWNRLLDSKLPTPEDKARFARRAYALPLTEDVVERAIEVYKLMLRGLTLTEACRRLRVSRARMSVLLQHVEWVESTPYRLLLPRMDLWTIRWQMVATSTYTRGPSQHRKAIMELRAPFSKLFDAWDMARLMGSSLLANAVENALLENGFPSIDMFMISKYTTEEPEWNFKGADYEGNYSPDQINDLLDRDDYTMLRLTENGWFMRAPLRMAFYNPRLHTQETAERCLKAWTRISGVWLYRADVPWRVPASRTELW